MNRTITLEHKLGHRFRNRSLLEQALTHPSLGKENNYQRLEFLGDAVLGLAVARLLFELYPQEREGGLAKRQAALVCGSLLTEVAREWELGKHLRMTASEKNSGGADTASNLEDACEAVIGALYLDGGMEPVKSLVDKYWRERALADFTPPRDAKTTLQEWAQGRGLPLPRYEEIKREGPAHAPEFTIEVTVQDLPPQCGRGSSKREAEQAAAAAMLAYVEGDNGKG